MKFYQASFLRKDLENLQSLQCCTYSSDISLQSQSAKSMKKELFAEIRKKCVELNLDPELLYSQLKNEEVLNWDEVSLINSRITYTEKINKIFALLEPKPEEMLLTLQNIFFNLKCVGLLNLVRAKLEESGDQHLIWQHPIGFSSIHPTFTDERMNSVLKNLKTHYKQDLELIENYWRRFGVQGKLDMNSFYNQNIIISNEKRKQIGKLKNFDDLFSNNYNRIILAADAGYGKSTFVHEMARQWMEGVTSWSKAFSLLFLFRLGEVNKKDAQLFENLLKKCLRSEDQISATVKWLDEAENMTNVLFIFDGLDELRQDFCDEIHSLIFGTGANLAHVIVTSRPCKKLEELEKRMCRNLYVELKGYTNEGVNQQLAKVSIDIEIINQDLRKVLVVPLFNTVFCITHNKSKISCYNICTTIASFVEFIINRYRDLKQNELKFENHEILMALGQAAQTKFSFISNVHIEYCHLSEQHLSIVKNAGLVMPHSGTEDLIFAHHTIAEHCAAYFWCKKLDSLVAKSLYKTNVYLSMPVNGCVWDYTDSFSRFLSYRNRDYKLLLWQNFEGVIPLFDEYHSLPTRNYNCRLLSLPSFSLDNSQTAMEKIIFSASFPLHLSDTHFESGINFENIKTINEIELENCSFNISPKEFFSSYTNLKILFFHNCKFNTNTEEMDNTEEINDINTEPLFLEKLKVWNGDGSENNFLSYIMTYCITLKSFELNDYTERLSNKYQTEWTNNLQKNQLLCDSIPNKYQTEWINNLQKNQLLCDSIETFSLDNIRSCTKILETIKSFVNLNELKLTLSHSLTESELHALSQSFANGLKRLNKIDLNLNLEKVNGEELFMYLSKLPSLVRLKLNNMLFTADTIQYLVTILHNLRLKHFELDFQQILHNEQIFDAIISCKTLESLYFRVEPWDLSYYNAFYKVIRKKNTKLKIQSPYNL